VNWVLALLTPRPPKVKRFRSPVDSSQKCLPTGGIFVTLKTKMGFNTIP
jgi:hypothetical protein